MDELEVGKAQGVLERGAKSILLSLGIIFFARGITSDLVGAIVSFVIDVILAILAFWRLPRAYAKWALRRQGEKPMVAAMLLSLFLVTFLTFGMVGFFLYLYVSFPLSRTWDELLLAAMSGVAGLINLYALIANVVSLLRKD